MRSLLVFGLALWGLLWVGYLGVVPAGWCGELLYSLKLPLEPRAPVEAVYPDGRRVFLGTVRLIPWKTRYPGFTASRNGSGGEVIASGANALHLLLDVEKGKGRTLSIIPSSTFVAVAGTGSSLVVEGVGGIGLFGRYAPPVGSRVYVVNRLGYRIPFRSKDLLKYGASLEIDVEAPAEDASYIRFENWEGGHVYLAVNGEERPVAVVEKPFDSSGRFLGTLYQVQGGVRANHPGVICVSTSPLGEIGGFQIVPLGHVYDHEMRKVRNMGQWMIVRGLSFERLEGTYPLFSGLIRPFDRSYGGNVGRVLCMMGDSSEWQDLPEALGVQPGVFSDVKEIKILLK